MNRHTRRALLRMAPLSAAAFFVACATTPSSAVSPPTLQDVQNTLQVVSQELPSLINEFFATGTVSATVKTEVVGTDGNGGYLAQFQALATSLMTLKAGSDPTTILNDIMAVIVTLAGLFPQSAPFVPLIMGLQLLIAALINQTPVAAAQKAPPTTASLTAMHAATRAYHK